MRGGGWLPDMSRLVGQRHHTLLDWRAPTAAPLQHPCFALPAGVNVNSTHKLGSDITMSGTSMPAPLVAGVAVRCYAVRTCYYPDDTSMDVLLSMTQDYNFANPGYKTPLLVPRRTYGDLIYGGAY